MTSLWTCPSCQHDNVAASRFCGGCAAPRSASDLSMTGGRTSTGFAPATPAPGPVSSPDLSISGQSTFGDFSVHRAPAASAALHPGLRVGRDARYELLTKLGEGGMGSVWKARDTQLGRDVAIKRILGQATPVLRERFQRETQAVTGLRHPNIVTVFDAGEDAFGLYLVMEFVPGHTLDVLLRKGALPAEQAVATMVGLCRGAAHAHKKGVVHRDIKPGNVMLDDDGTPRLLDFGLVRMDGASELSMTGVGMGTLDYAAPEQKRDASKADARSDVYALGLVFYEMLTGLRPPVTLKRAPEVWRTLIEGAADSVAEDRPANAEQLLSQIEAINARIAEESVASHMLGADDMRCPSCRVLNALEAKVCRSCGASLRMRCPACGQLIRLGLSNCDQCFASVGAVSKLRAGSEALDQDVACERPADSRAHLDSLNQLTDGAGLGSADDISPLLQEKQAQLNRVVEANQDGFEGAGVALIASGLGRVGNKGVVPDGGEAVSRSVADSVRYVSKRDGMYVGLATAFVWGVAFIIIGSALLRRCQS